jgi:hypothetical protein
MKSGGINLLEPDGPHRACYGTPLSFSSIKLYPMLCHLARYLKTHVIFIISMAFINLRGELN